MSLTSAPFLLTAYPWGQAQRQVLKQAMAPAMWYGMWIVPIVGCTWLLLCAVAPRVGSVFGAVTPAIAGGLCAVVFVLLARRRNTGLRAAFNASAFRAGNWQVTIADDGLHLDSENVRQIFAWHALSEVRDGPGGLLIMMGAAVFLPIPATAFGATADFAACRAALGARIAAKGAA